MMPLDPGPGRRERRRAARAARAAGRAGRHPRARSGRRRGVDHAAGDPRRARHPGGRRVLSTIGNPRPGRAAVADINRQRRGEIMQVTIDGTVVADAPESELVKIEGNWYFPPSALSRGRVQRQPDALHLPVEGRGPVSRRDHGAAERTTTPRGAIPTRTRPRSSGSGRTTPATSPSTRPRPRSADLSRQPARPPAGRAWACGRCRPRRSRRRRGRTRTVRTSRPGGPGRSARPAAGRPARRPGHQQRGQPLTPAAAARWRPARSGPTRRGRSAAAASPATLSSVLDPQLAGAPARGRDRRGRRRRSSARRRTPRCATPGCRRGWSGRARQAGASRTAGEVGTRPRMPRRVGWEPTRVRQARAMEPP